MSRRVGSVGTLCLAIVLASSGAVAQEVDLPSGTAEAIEASDWQTVAQLLEPSVASNPSEANSYWYGVSQFELGNPRGAIGHLRSAAAANPQSLACAQYLARCAVLSNDTDALDKLAEAFPLDAEISLHAGKAWMAKYYAAKKREEEVFTVFPDKSNECKKNAIKHLSRAASLADDWAETHHWYAFALYGDYETSQALDEIRKAISLAPMGWESYVLMADCFERGRYYAEAAEALERAAELAPHKRSNLEFRRGQTLIKAEQYAQAVEAFRTVMQLDFNHRSVRYWLGKAAYGAGDYRLALWAFVEARADDPNPPSDNIRNAQIEPKVGPLFWAGRCAYELGNYEDAERLMTQAKDEAGGTLIVRPLWAHYLGRVQWKLQKYDEAMKNLQAAFEYDPNDLIYARWVFQGHLGMDDPYAAIELCSGLAEKGYPEVAVEGIKTVIRKWPNPRPKDRQAGQRIPHTLVGSDAMTKIEFDAGHFRTAAMMYKAGGRHQGRRVHPDAGWAMLAAGDFRGASTAFRDLTKYNKGYWADYGMLGGGCTLVLRGYNEQAVKLLSQIKNPKLATSRHTAMLWASIGHNHPSARSRANKLTLLGAIGWEGRAPDEEIWHGMKIRAVIPGSLLDSASIDVRPSDVLVGIGSDMILSANWLRGWSREAPPIEPVEILIERDKYRFTVTVDYSEAMAKIAPREPKADDEETP